MIVARCRYCRAWTLIEATTRIINLDCWCGLGRVRTTR